MSLRIIKIKIKPFKIGFLIILVFLVLAKIAPTEAFAASPGLDAYNRQDYEGAEKYFKGESEKNPGDYRAQYNLGTSLYQLKRYEESSQAFEKSVDDKPDFQYGWYNLGMAYARQNRYQDAADAFNKALELNPKDEDAKQNLEIVKKKAAENPKGDKSQNGGKYGKNYKPGSKSTANATPIPTGTPLAEMPTPPPDRKNEKEDENADKKVKDQNAKKKYKSNEPSNQSVPGKNAEKNQKNGNGQQNGNNNDAAAREKQQDQQRREEAKKQLSMSDQQVQNLMKQLQQQEKNTQQYYSANPNQDQKQQSDVWNYLPREQQEFMRRFFGQPQKGKADVPEDW